MLGGSAVLRARLPRIVRARAPGLGVWAIWVYHPLITRRLVGAAHGIGIEVVAWTVDEAARMLELERLGVDGICTNDPRLLVPA
jgi:glycerophosphoryl diester phosphodiesterase